MGKLGAFLIVIAVGLLFFNLSPLLFSDNEPILNIMEPVLCAPGENLTMRVIVTHDYDGTGYSGDYDCVRPNETSYDVSAKAFIMAGAMFVVPFLIGLFMVITAFNRSMRGMIPAGVMEINTGRPRSRGMAAEVINAAPPSQRYSFEMPAVPDAAASSQPAEPPAETAAPALTARLQQLRDAYDTGMITYSEYERTRAELLKDFANGV